MRAVECWCGLLVHGEDDEEVVARLREHVAKAHPGEHDDAAVRERAAAQAYEPPTGEPPWAY
jgi:predicted small metal-binding protein